MSGIDDLVVDRAPLDVIVRAFASTPTGGVLGAAFSIVLLAAVAAPSWAIWVLAAVAAVASCSAAVMVLTRWHRGHQTITYLLQDSRGRAVLSVRLTSASTASMTGFAAVPRGEGLGSALAKPVLADYLERGFTVRCWAWPAMARRYLEADVGFEADVPRGRLVRRLVARPSPSSRYPR